MPDKCKYFNWEINLIWDLHFSEFLDYSIELFWIKRIHTNRGTCTVATITNDFDFYWISAGCLCLFAACRDSPESDDWQKAGARSTGDQQGQYCRSCGSWQESWFLTGVTQLVLSDSGVSVQWEGYWYHDSRQEAWSVYGLWNHWMLSCILCLFNKPTLDVVTYMYI